MNPPAPLIDWAHVLRELQTFLSVFAVAGALGFRWSGLAAAERIAGSPEERITLDSVLWSRLPAMAQRRGLGIGEFLVSDFATALQAALLGILFAAFVVALMRPRLNSAWIVAAVAFVAVTLRAGLFGQWDRVVNPVHRAAGGVWIGSLFMLVAIGMPLVLRSTLPPEARGRLAARMVHGFSPLALVAAMVLVGFGVITAAQHLPWPAALWTTPYGRTLMIKLAVVSVVFGFGAFHFFKRAKLGGVEAAGRLHRSAATELAVATVVLLITAVLVSLPTPKLPGR
jgi:putative copper export protein